MWVTDRRKSRNRTAVCAGVTNEPRSLSCLSPALDQCSHSILGLCPDTRRAVAVSNSGNGNLRPETLGATRRERSPERAKPTAETGSPRTGYGNVGLFLT